jgi:hypothetical protein
METLEPAELERLKAELFAGFERRMQPGGIHVPLGVLYTWGTRPA